MQIEIEKPNWLRILGKVNRSVLKQLSLTGDWYFVDYSPEDYPVGTVFFTNSNKITLTTCHLQFKNSFIDEISHGWKTLCQFECTTPLDLEVLDSWQSNSRSVMAYKGD